MVQGTLLIYFVDVLSLVCSELRLIFSWQHWYLKVCQVFMSCQQGKDNNKHNQSSRLRLSFTHFYLKQSLLLWLQNDRKGYCRWLVFSAFVNLCSCTASTEVLMASHVQYKGYTDFLLLAHNTWDVKFSDTLPFQTLSFCQQCLFQVRVQYLVMKCLSYCLSASKLKGGGVEHVRFQDTI